MNTFKSQFVAIGFCCLFFTPVAWGLAFPQEKATLTTPLAQPSLVDVSIIEIRIGRNPWILIISFTDNTGKNQIDYHNGIFNAVNNPNGADVLVKALNKANLSVKSLECRAIEHLVSEGKIPPATCTGVPQ